MISFIKKNIGSSIMLIGLSIAGILLLANALIKAVFILSNESAVQKAEVIDIVLGTIALALVLVAALGLAVATTWVAKTKIFNKTVLQLLGLVAGILIVGTLLVIVKDHTNWVTDWKKLNDADQARSDIGSNLSLLHTLVDDRFGNQGYAMGGMAQLNTLKIQEYDAFLHQMIASKQDLAALYPIDELLNTAHQPLLAGRFVDAMAAAYQADTTHHLTAHAWFASTSTTNAYDFQNVIKTVKVDFTNDGQLHKIINGLMQQPIIYTSTTTAYLQGFPIDITGIVIVATTLAIATPFVAKEYKSIPQGLTIIRVNGGQQ